MNERYPPVVVLFPNGAYYEYLHFMAKRRHGSAVQDFGENPKCRSGSQDLTGGFGVTLRAGADFCGSENNGGVVMHPANMAWFGDFLCQKRVCSIFPKVGVKTCKKIDR